MKTPWLAAPLLALVPILFAQDRPKDAIELPLKRAALAPEPEKFDLSKTGIEWKKGLDAALHQGKPILLFQLLGNLDDVYC
jgi:hypothetical protein